MLKITATLDKFMQLWCPEALELIRLGLHVTSERIFLCDCHDRVWQEVTQTLLVVVHVDRCLVRNEVLRWSSSFANAN